MNKRVLKRVGLGTLGCLICLGLLVPLVGFHYPHVVEDEPLRAPVKVVGVQGATILLEDGRTLVLDWIQDNTISIRLKQSDFLVDLESDGRGMFYVHARQDGWVCGTPWAQPIRIPLFRDTVYRNKREFIALGRPADSQDGPANGSQPIRSETNSMSSAAGSRR